MNIHFPTTDTARTVGIAWGAVDRKLYAASNQYKHTGVDLYDPEQETPIYAVSDGIVEWSGYQSAHGYGRHVLIRHASIGEPVFYTRYAHLADLGVVEGQQVKAGQQIGVMGGELSDPYRGMSGGKHLHFELLVPDQPKDHDYIWIDWMEMYSVDPLLWLADTFLHFEMGTLTVSSYDGLNVRTLPSVYGQKIGALPYKAVRVFMDSAKDDSGNLWVRLRSLRKEWVCVEYKGRELAEVFIANEITPFTEPEPEETQPEPQALTLESLQSQIESLQSRMKRLEQIAGI